MLDVYSSSTFCMMILFDLFALCHNSRQSDCHFDNRYHTRHLEPTPTNLVGEGNVACTREIRRRQEQEEIKTEIPNRLHNPVALQVAIAHTQGIVTQQRLPVNNWWGCSYFLIDVIEIAMFFPKKTTPSQFSK